MRRRRRRIKRRRRRGEERRRRRKRRMMWRRRRTRWVDIIHIAGVVEEKQKDGWVYVVDIIGMKTGVPYRGYHTDAKGEYDLHQMLFVC